MNPIKHRHKHRCSRKVISSCSTCCTRRVTPVRNQVISHICLVISILDICTTFQTLFIVCCKLSKCRKEVFLSSIFILPFARIIRILLKLSVVPFLLNQDLAFLEFLGCLTGCLGSVEIFKI